MQTGAPDDSSPNSAAAGFPTAASPLGDSSLALSNLELVARIGLSLACNETCSRKSHSKVNSPGLILRSLASFFPRPFDSKLHTLVRFAPSKGCFLASRPLRVPFETRLAASPLPLPFRTLTSFRIKAFRGLAACQARLPFRPIPVRSPPPPYF
jgi:hypothetical protein